MLGLGKWTLIRRARKTAKTNKDLSLKQLNNDPRYNPIQSLYKNKIAPQSFVISPVRDLRAEGCPSRLVYTTADLEFLGLGEGYTPLPKQLEIQELDTAKKKLILQINRAHFFYSATGLPDEDEEQLKFKKSKISKVSKWRPPIHDPAIMEGLDFLISKLNYTVLSNRQAQHAIDDLHWKSRKLKDRPDIKLVSTDKNMGFALLSITDYDRMVLTLLDDARVYRKIDSNNQMQLQHDYQETVQIFLKKYFKSLTEKERLFIQGYSTNISAVFHILPKVHKNIPMPNIPVRPITGIRPSAITSKISTIVTEKLLPLMKHLPNILDNSYPLIQDLEGSLISDTEWFYSIDFESLYTSIRLDDLYFQLDQALINQDDIDAIKFIFNNNYFRYKNDIYQQLDGIAMGTSAAPVLANIYLEYKFDIVVRNVAALKRYYKRFIDDSFGIFNGTIEEFDLIINSLNELIYPMRITYVIDKNSIDFLDLTIFRNQFNQINFKTYQKALNRYSYIPFHSHCPMHLKKGWIIGELIRYVRTNTTTQDYDTIRKLFYERLQRKGYSDEFLLPLFTDTRVNHNREILRPENRIIKIDKRKSLSLAIRFTTNNKTFEEIGRILRDYNQNSVCRIDLVYKSNPTLTRLTTRSGVSGNQIEFLELT